MSGTVKQIGSRLLDDIVELARIPAPTFSEEMRLEWIEERLTRAPGLRTRDEAGNLLWTWGEGPPRLLLAAHVDTVFGLETPLEMRREGRSLIGPGIGDNAAAVAVAMHVVDRLLRQEELASGAVAFTVGEEGLGNLRGAATVCDCLRPEAFIALEGHGLERVIVDAVGSVRTRITVAGPGGHPWVDRGRPSAVHALLDLGAALIAGFDHQVTVNVGLVSGGRAVNAIADEAELVLEARAVEEVLLDAVVDKLGRLVVPPPLELSVEIAGRRPAGRLEREAPLLRLVRKVRAEIGLPDSLTAGSTDANAALARRIPALALGVAAGAEMHTLRERIEIDSLGLGRRQLELLLVRMLASTE